MRADFTWADGLPAAAVLAGIVAGVLAGMTALAVCTAAIGWRSRSHAARVEQARRATLDLVTAVADLRADLHAAATPAERGLAVARWRSRWMLGAALLDLVDAAHAERVRRMGRRLYAELMAGGADVRLTAGGVDVRLLVGGADGRDGGQRARAGTVRELAAHRARRVRPQAARPLVPR
ncbi:hypothetical protein MF672_037055 [Actinomadura sp. ATCC 31491]|uniref:Diguanylate cyclase n=1 Tax=Actinomadura luzonensis TaxID=2805427 RepID=A0ABT0G448_9ACTN|nr:hypothetical protein [Actinomadura luzonensis]MCK2219366.1 hypothetical protein [Actinomadura luzonensis]